LVGKVQIDQGSQALEVEPFRRGIRSDDQAQFPGRNSFFDFIPVRAVEFAFFDDPGFRCTGIDADLFVGHAFRQIQTQPEDRVIILAEDDTAQGKPAAGNDVVRCKNPLNLAEFRVLIPVLFQDFQEAPQHRPFLMG